jgi:hypothetical protein
MCALGLPSELCKILEYVREDGEFVVRAGVNWKPGVVGRAKAERIWKALRVSRSKPANR